MNIEKVIEVIFANTESGVLFIIGVIITVISICFLTYKLTALALHREPADPVTLERYALENDCKVSEYKETETAIFVIFTKESAEIGLPKKIYNFKDITL